MFVMLMVARLPVTMRPKSDEPAPEAPESVTAGLPMVLLLNVPL